MSVVQRTASVSPSAPQPPLLCRALPLDRARLLLRLPLLESQSHRTERVAVASSHARLSASHRRIFRAALSRPVQLKLRSH